MRRALLIADDLTGAADSGVQFARAGWRTLLVLEPGGSEDADVLVMTSESRGLPDDTSAAQDVKKVLADCSPSPFPLVYKKIDSTLRGHPAAELAAVMSVLSEAHALIAPAFPAQGRTTQDGRVMVNGSPLEQTTFANKVSSGDLRHIFGDDADLLPLDTIRGGESRLQDALRGASGLLIADAENEGDLLLLAQAALAEGIRLWCGSAGLAGALVACLGSKADAHAEAPLSPSHPPGTFLAVAGSLHPVTAAQVAAARRAGTVVVQPPPEFFTSPHPQGITETAVRLAHALASGRDAILTVLSPADLMVDRDYNQNIIGYAQPENAIPPTQIAARLAQTAALALETASPSGLFLTGGETARAVCQTLGCTHLWLGGEVEPGIPWSHIADGRFPGMLVITKAGGFGGEDSLVHAFRLPSFPQP